MRRHAPSSFRTTTLTILVGSFLLLTIISYWVVRSFVGVIVADSEAQLVSSRLERLSMSLDGEVGEMRATSISWGQWDDAYRYLETPYPAFEQNMTGGQQFHDAGIDALIYFDLNGRIVTSAFLQDREKMLVEPVPPSMREAAGKLIGQPPRRSTGFVRVGQNIAAFAVEPVLPTSAVGAAHGSVVALRVMDAAAVSRLSKAVGFSLHWIGDETASALAARAPQRSGRGFSTPEQLPSTATATELAAIHEIRDAHGLVIGRLVLTMPRTMLQRSNGAMRELMIASLIICLLLVAVSAWLIDGRVARPVAHLSKAVREVALTGDPRQRISGMPGDGELAQVAENINAMLDKLEAQHGLRESRDAAIAASRLKSEFLANMSHEIRTPMNGVLGALQLLHRTDLSEEQRTWATTALRSGEALLTLLNDILDFSKLEAAKLRLDSEAFNVGELVEEIGSLMAGVAHGKGLEISCCIDPRAREIVMGDSGRVRQILGNLVGNAVKFTSRGEVDVRVIVQQQTDAETRMLFEVRDTGIGIAEGDRNKLFQLFSQVDASTTRKFGGTGLGLAISRELAQLMGGEIGVDSQPGRGSRFWFTACFPAAKSVSAAEPDARLSALRGKRVLVATPHERTGIVAVALLEEFGCSVESALSVDALTTALIKARANEAPYDVLICDPRLCLAPVGPLAEWLARASVPGASHLIQLRRLAEPAAVANASFPAATTKLVLPLRSELLLLALHQSLTNTGEHFRRQQPQAELTNLRGRVLVVEDNPVNLAVARAMLSGLGLDVATATNGEEGLHAIEALRPDLVLMDCQMPVLDGFDATERLRRHEAESGQSRMTVIAMTANALAGDRERCLAVGMDDYLAKPFRREQLIERLTQWLPNHEATQPQVPAAIAGAAPFVANAANS